MVKKVLVVDDEPEICDCIRDYLEGRGFVVATAKDGREAIGKVETDNPDLVLLDLVMPGLSGLDTLKAIKRINDKVIVIIMTGRGTTETAIESLQLGAYDHIAKPFQLEELLKLIKEALSRSL